MCYVTAYLYGILNRSILYYGLNKIKSFARISRIILMHMKVSFHGQVVGERVEEENDRMKRMQNDSVNYDFFY